MKQALFATLLILAIAPFAHAKNVAIEGDAAESFIARHFPDADIPGPVSGTFKYTNRLGEQKQGYAECFVPAMGGRSDGAVSSCSVIY